MSGQPRRARIGYFGKLPARADFLKSAGNVALAGLLDGWLAAAMHLLVADPRWKINYDALRPLDFAFVGTRSRRAIAGRLAASGDASGRRYPFLAMSAIEIAQPARFVARSPLALAPLWDEMGLLMAAVLEAAEPEAALGALAAAAPEIDPGAARHELAFADFLDRHSLATLAAMLAMPEPALRRMVLAIGLLLRPVRRSGAARLDKSMVLPLPRQGGQRHPGAAFWLALIAPFLCQADFELALFFAEPRGEPCLVVGFGGAAPETLQAIIDPRCAARQQITFDDAGWVDELIRGDAGVQKLSAWLEQGRLSLRSALALFHETLG